MDELRERDPAAVEPEPITPEEEERPTALVIAQFFLIPLAIILACAGLFVLFGLLTGDEKDAADYLAEVQSGSADRRYQAAFELSKVLARDPTLAREPGFVPELTRVFQERRGQEPALRRYLALALGRVADPRSVDALIAGLADDDSQTRIYVIWALGAVGDARASPHLADLLRDPDPGVRKMAAYALGNLGDPAVAAPLRQALEDPAADVQWNAALSLGRLRDRAALPALHRMLDRGYLDRIEGVTPEQKEEAVVNAIQALRILADPESIGLIEALATGDPSIPVRAAAHAALAELRGER